MQRKKTPADRRWDFSDDYLSDDEEGGALSPEERWQIRRALFLARGSLKTSGTGYADHNFIVLMHKLAAEFPQPWMQRHLNPPPFQFTPKGQEMKNRYCYECRMPGSKARRDARRRRYQMGAQVEAEDPSFGTNDHPQPHEHSEYILEEEHDLGEEYNTGSHTSQHAQQQAQQAQKRQRRE